MKFYNYKEVIIVIDDKYIVDTQEIGTIGMYVANE